MDSSSSWLLLCTAALLLTSLSSAVKDERDMEQRDVTFDIDTIMQEKQQPDSLLLQKEVDLTDFLDPKEFLVEQVMDPPPEPSENDRGGSKPAFTPRGGRPRFGPRSYPPAGDYPVTFPLARPTADNVQAICLHGDHRPRYPDSYFPLSGFGQLKRRAGAVNNAEAWFSTCCTGNQTWGEEVTLCCATQAWELSVETFCRDDSSVKDRLYECCRQKGRKRLNCFHSDAPNPNYEPTVELPVPALPSAHSFTFDPNTCQSTASTEQLGVRGNSGQTSTSQTAGLNFPPGRPTAASVESLCDNRSLRPLYNIKCLPSSGYEMLALQAKTINRVEKRFKQCCKKKQDVLTCADQKWRQELNRFCSNKKSGKVEFQCCSAQGAIERFQCFQKMAPEPHYNTSAEQQRTLSFSKLCDFPKMVKKMLPGAFPLKKTVGNCCPLPREERNACFVENLEDISNNLCLTKKASPPALRRCCHKTPEESPQCITKILMDAITKATSMVRQKKRKICPIS